ncbi:hypothetical protein FBU30_008368 [Linnemannia zychae]|nr:hypothetical protein FBU30_008368 [Linnemannia zychae]
MATETNDKPKVLIVGAGLGGLMLGALLEKSGIPYTIFERTPIVKPLGSAMAVGPALLAIFQQLNIYDEFLAVSKYMTHIEGHNEALVPRRPNDYTYMEEFTGYKTYIVTRPCLYNLFLKQVPAHKIHFGKRVLNFTEKDGKINVQASDNMIYEGDILVGADGAYSAIRQRLYERLKKEDKVPPSDLEQLPFHVTCLVGQTDVVSADEFKDVGFERCRFKTFIGDDKPYTWVTFTTKENRIAWMVMHLLDAKTSKEAYDQRFRASENSEWGSCPAMSMCEETRNFPIRVADGDGEGIAKTLGDLYDRTPKDGISKVMLEEKVFQTWYHGRTVLLGDGAVTAIHDAAALANLLYAMPNSTSDEITRIFQEYQAERLPIAIAASKASEAFKKFSQRTLLGLITRFIAAHMPSWLWKRIIAKLVYERPQLGFVEPIPLMGTIPPAVSPSTKKARDVYGKRKKQEVSPI